MHLENSIMWKQKALEKKECSCSRSCESVFRTCLYYCQFENNNIKKKRKITRSSKYTVWKLQNFSVTQIYLKSILEILEIQKMPFFQFYIGALNIVILLNFILLQWQELLKIKMQSLKICWNGRFETLDLPTLISRKIWVT